MPKHPPILSRPRRPIPGYEGLYEITRRGHVYSVRAKKIIQNTINTAFSLEGKEIIQFQIGGKTIQMGVHKTVAEVWIGDEERAAILADLEEAKRTAGKGENPHWIVGNTHALRYETVYYLACRSQPNDHPSNPISSSISQT